MPVFLFRKAVVTPPSVGTNLRAWLNRRRDKRNQAGTGNVVNSLYADTAKPLWRQYFDGHHHDELGLGAAPANTALDAAHIGFIDLDRAMKPISSRPHHGRAQLLQDGPSGLITSQPQQPL